MANPLSLEERTIGYLLSMEEDIEERVHFLGKGSDCLMLMKEEKGEVAGTKMEIAAVNDFHSRNPFISAHCRIFARNILEDAIKAGDYDVCNALFRAMPEPRQDMFFVPSCLQTRLMFYYAAGLKMNLELEARRKLKEFASAYEAYWQRAIDKAEYDLAFGYDSAFTEESLKEKKGTILSYNLCTDPLFIREPKSPALRLLHGDLRIAEVMAGVTPERLRRYAEKYRK